MGCFSYTARVISLLAQSIGCALIAVPAIPCLVTCSVYLLILIPALLIFDESQFEDCFNTFFVLSSFLLAIVTLPGVGIAVIVLKLVGILEAGPLYYSLLVWLFSVAALLFCMGMAALNDEDEDEDKEGDQSVTSQVLGKHKHVFMQLVSVILKRVGSTVAEGAANSELSLSELISVAGYLTLVPTALAAIVSLWLDEERVELQCVTDVPAANCTGIWDAELCCSLDSVNTDPLAFTAYVFSNLTLAVVMIAILIRVSLHNFLRKHTITEAVSALGRSATMGRRDSVKVGTRQHPAVLQSLEEETRVHFDHEPVNVPFEEA